MNNEMDKIVTCKFCGAKVRYGDTVMISGHTGCPNCYDKKVYGLYYVVNYLKNENYGAYMSGNFYKRGYQWCKENIDNIDYWD